jgi:hypothetical protein
MGIPAPGLPRGAIERVADEALRGALSELCGASSWRGVARGVAWEVVSGDPRKYKALDELASAAEGMLGTLIDEALWVVERTVLETWEEFLEVRPHDEAGAFVAVALDAREESLRLVAAARQQVLEALHDLRTRAA